MYIYIYFFFFFSPFLLWLFIEGSFEVKLSTKRTDEATEVGRVREEKGRRKKSREENESEERRGKRAKG